MIIEDKFNGFYFLAVETAAKKLDRLVNLNIELGIAPGSILLNQV